MSQQAKMPGGDSSAQDRLRRKVREAERRADDALGELDSIVAALKAVIENCRTATPKMIRHQLVGLLPECQEMEPEQKAELRAAGMGHLVDRHDEDVRRNWAEYGYGESPSSPDAGTSA